MNKKVRIVKTSKVVEDGINTEYLIPKSNFWLIFRSLKDKEKLKQKKFFNRKSE